MLWEKLAHKPMSCYGKQIRVSLITTSGPQASACLSLVLRAEPGLHQDRWESHPQTVKSSVFFGSGYKTNKIIFYWERNITITNSSVRSVIARMLWKVQTVILLASEIFNFNLGKSHYSKHWIQDSCCLRLCLTMDSEPGLILWLDIVLFSLFVVGAQICTQLLALKIKPLR